jgi:cation diffusion facilitator family transporter
MSELPADEKHAVARRTTVVSVAVNAMLATAQIGIGGVAHSQSLVADGVHSLADIFSDFVVLFANRHSSARPDVDHNYGHSRYETVASLFLGVLLAIVGAGMLWRAGTRLGGIDAIPPVHLSALLVALVVLASKEALFRYMLREATRVRSAMLVANAWHARSDAASSLVVAIGIGGSLCGLKWFDPVAALIVGVFVGKMGVRFAWDAMQDLSDRALDEAATGKIRATLLDTPGVRGLDELRTRKTGDFALVDAHVLVDPRITVSEGHYIAEAARARLLQHAHVLDALIHVDPESDVNGRPEPGLPTHRELLAATRMLFAELNMPVDAINVHYLRDGLELEVQLCARKPPEVDAQSGVPAGMAEKLGVRMVRVLRVVDAAARPAERAGQSRPRTVGARQGGGAAAAPPP